MTRQQILGVCIMVSLLLHLWGLGLHWRGNAPAEGGEIVIPADFAIAASDPGGDSLALVQAEAPDDNGKKAESAARRLRRQARVRYFKRVREAIEHRKFPPGSNLTGIIGNVLYSFRILPDDSFADVRLRRSSGDPLLDRAARDAILAASGKIKRPHILKGQGYTLSVAVKYQYSL